MRSKRDIQKIHRHLKKVRDVDDTFDFGYRLFEWLTNLELPTEDILPELDIRKKKLLQEQYNANKVPGWVMLTPQNEWLFVEERPSHMPKRWWQQIDLSNFDGTPITYDMDIFNLRPYNLMEYILHPYVPNWEDEYNLFLSHKDYFRNVKEVNKYLIGEFGSVDESTKIIFSPEDRKNHVEQYKIYYNQLKNYYRTEFNYAFAYEYKHKNEIFWVLKKL